MKITNPFKTLNKFEWSLWIISLAAITASFFACGNTNYATLATSLIGVTSLIFAAKGNALAPTLMIAFSLIYAFVSYTFGYYGESLIYICMQLPVCIASLISWLKHPSGKNGATKIGNFKPIYALIIAISVVAVTASFYFILRVLGTQNIIVSTVSVATSFVALFLMALRLPAYALAFVLNDIVLIVLWSFAVANSLNYLPMVICFSIFLINDTYSFICWTKRKKSQQTEERQQSELQSQSAQTEN